MSGWFDSLSDRAVRGESAVSRRDALKAGGAGLLAASVLGSPRVAEGSEAVADLLSASSCRCHDRADRNWNRQMDKLVSGGKPLTSLISPTTILLEFGAISALGAGYAARKLSCGSCRRNESGGGKPPPPSHSPGQIGGGSGPSSCPENTVGCAQSSTCCYAGDLCCPCRGDFICCISAVGCACC